MAESQLLGNVGCLCYSFAFTAASVNAGFMCIIRDRFIKMFPRKNGDFDSNYCHNAENNDHNIGFKEER
jgi:hypothetical protein